MNKLLQIKAWQLFAILLIIPFSFQIIGISLLLFIKDQHPITYSIVCSLLMVISCASFFGWFYILGINLYKLLPRNSTMSLTKFKVFLFIPILYFVAIAILFGGTLEFPTNDDGLNILDFTAIIIPIHLLSMFGIFYCLYFNAKALKMAELQRPVTFRDFAGEFFLIWFFPIGIWILQPRINKLFSSHNNQHAEEDSSLRPE